MVHMYVVGLRKSLPNVRVVCMKYDRHVTYPAFVTSIFQYFLNVIHFCDLIRLFSPHVFCPVDDYCNL